MSESRTHPLRPHSAAVLEATLLRLWSEPAALARALQRRGVSLAPRARRRKRHPLLVELWKVRRGQLMVGSLPLRDACAVAYAGILAAPIAFAHAVGGTTDSNAATEALRRLSSLGANVGRDGADMLIGRLGTYHEVMLSVPDIENPTGVGSCRVVLAMLTDSRLSQLGAAGFGFRLGKRIAQISREGFATYSVASAARRLLHGRFEASGSAAASGSAPDWQPWLDQPLFGVEKSGSGAMSQLSYVWKGAEITRVQQGELFLASVLSEQLCSERVLIARGGLSHAEAFHVRNLHVQLSYPVGQRWGSVAKALHGA